jgi:hypothetical protein
MVAEINGFSIPALWLTIYVFVSMFISVGITLILTGPLTKKVRLVCCFLAFVLCFSLYGQWIYLALMSLFSFRLNKHHKFTQQNFETSSQGPL